MKFGQISDLIGAAKNIAIISHKNPDGDTIGANLALRYYLQSIGKIVASACVDKPKANYDWLLEIDKFVQNFSTVDDNGRQKFDLIMSVDSSSEAMLGFTDVRPKLNIDHHISNTNFADINIVDADASSTSFIIYKIFKELGWLITRNVATALLTGIYFDTGSFMHSNTNTETLKAASELTRLGADKTRIVKSLFKTMTIPQIKLWGKILEKIKTTERGITVSVVTSDDLKECGASQEETERVIDFLNTNEEGRFCVLLVENIDKGIIKGSARTRGEEIDLSGVCKLLGGGGHKKAGGFSFPGKIIEETIFKIKKD
ncbi:DHH family phosphoesterase [Candidatus Peregrinibacteria bacterium]|nr:DHH family phosphoesterase [Candidatus Peregrinibacteria bacterium]